MGASIATAGLVGNGGSQAGMAFTQRLAINGIRSAVRAGVSSVIQNRDFTEALKEGGMSALVDSISGSLAQSIGGATQFSPLEKMAAHFGVGAGMGAFLDRDHPLSSAITGGAGAVIGEAVAETLVDRQQMQIDVLQDMRRNGIPYSAQAYTQAYREKLRPYVDAGRLVAGSVIAAAGRDPSIAIAAATNALENNFSGCVPLPERGQIPVEIQEASWNIGRAAKDAAVEMAEEFWENPDVFVEETALGFIPGGDLARKRYNGEEITYMDLALEAGFTCLPYVGGSIKAAGRKAAKFLGKFAQKLERGAKTAKVNRSATVDALDLADTTKKLMGEYRHVRGHHVHAKSAFVGHASYDPKKGFSISEELMNTLGIEHKRVTTAQQKLFVELGRSGAPNTLAAHTQIAVEALVSGGASRVQAQSIVARSLKDLEMKGINNPTNIPWFKGK